jgi:hypothetical protein
MTCERFGFADGTAGGFICGPRQRRHHCCTCGVLGATFQCDGDRKKSGKTCDRYLCEACAVEVGPDQHLCPRCYAAEGATYGAQAELDLDWKEATPWT